ncbi:MAG TPA: DNA repair protein RecN [Thermoleophilaceae bacterium]|nr:DNA repair protein RecN [Thermoleophilaceae bacterium]
MVSELRIENLLLIERAELRPGPGLTAITGETGAGKTVLAHALDLLMGGKPRPGIVRPGAREAYVEGVFELPPGLLEEPELADLRERIGIEDDDGEDEAAAATGSAADGSHVAPSRPTEIVLARRVGAGGRTRAFVQGRSATAADLQVLGGRLLAFFGQHEHRRLTLASAQLELLDGFCGRDHLGLRDELGRAHAEVRELERRLAELRERAGTRDRDLDLLAFEIEEIDALAPTEAEKESLLAERERLRRMDGLLAAAGGGAEAIAPEGDSGAASFAAGGRLAGAAGGYRPGGSDAGFGVGPGVAALLAEAEHLAGAVQGVDPALDELAGRLAALRIEAEDLGGELRRYAESLEPEPGRLQQVEERLDAYERLERKHGGSVAAVLAHSERCRARRDELEQAEVATERLERELAAALARRDDLARRLSEGRAAAAPSLAERVREELTVLAMEGATFEVRLDPREEIGAVGAERVELLLAPNPGVPAAPIRETASGGELSRVMLALMTVAGAGESRTLVFDEVDAGIGGQTARAVGERLRGLAETRQVLCITHLPQIAALAASHFRIEKSTAGDATLTSVEEIAGEGVVEELVRMLGAESSDKSAWKHAEELLA